MFGWSALLVFSKNIKTILDQRGRAIILNGMNYTESGIIAQGAPHSPVRFKSEAEHAKDTGQYQLLLLTEEGNIIVNRYLLAMGCDYTEMPLSVKVEYLNKKEAFHFLAGYLFAANNNKW